MDIDNEIFRVFSALDSNNQGFINKNDFLEKILEFVNSSNENDEKNLIKIKQLMKPYIKIGLDEFKDIYSEIQKLKEDKDETLDFINSSNLCDSSQSSDSSDIDNFEFKGKYDGKEDILSTSPINSVDSFVSESFLSSPSSASKHGRELLINSKSTLHKIINAPLDKNCNIGLSDINDNRSHQQWDNKEMEAIICTNEKLIDESIELKNRLKEEQRRFEMEKDNCKSATAKIYLLESLIHDQEIEMREQMKQCWNDCNDKLQSMEELMRATADDFTTRYADIEKQLAVVRNDNRNLLLRYQQLSSENEALQKDVRQLQNQNHDNETILLEYKKVASHQVTELQSERDKLEMMNVELNNQLLSIKHLSPTKELRKRSLVTESPLSEAESRRKLKHRNSMGSFRSHDNYVTKTQIDSIESDANRLVHLLTMENRNLVERIAHLETVGFYQRQKLEAANCLSIADEMEKFNYDELKTALTVERETVKTLQKYMETLTNKLLLAGYIDVFQQL